jgi:LruC domain-containing protein
MKNITISIISLTMMIFASCKKNATETLNPVPGETVQSLTDLFVPAGFNWSTQKEIKLQIKSPLSNGAGGNYDIKVYDGNPFAGGQLLTQGAASGTRFFDTKVAVGTQVNELYFLATSQGRSTSMYKASTSPQMNVDLSSMQTQSAGNIRLNETTPASPVCTTGCTTQVSLTNNQSVTISNGATLCVSGSSLTFNVTFGTGGGKLRICGTGVKVQNLNNNAGQSDIAIEITSGSNVTFANLNFNNGNNILTNWGTTTIENNLAMAGAFINYGTLNVNQDYNINSEPTGNLHTNYGIVRVGKTLNINSKSTYDNRGKTYIEVDLAVNGQGQLINKCLIVAKGVFSNNSLVDNYGLIKVGERSQLNGNTDYNQYPGAMLLTKDFMVNSRVRGLTGSSLIKVTDKTTINGGGSVEGFIQLCDINGIETQNGNISNGATIACDLYVEKTDCNPEGNGVAQCPDADNDGVCDADDCYPNDPAKAYCNTVPTGTIAFEDNWPFTGDYDMNDVVMQYTYKVITNASNKVVRVEGDYQLRATGGGFKNAFAVQFPVEASKVTGVTGATLEAGQTKAVIVLFENMRAETTQWNTFRGQAVIPAKTYNISFNIANGPALSEFGLGVYNPFLWNNSKPNGRGYETHLPGTQPTEKANPAFFGTNNDGTVPGTANTYITKNGKYPWALHIPARFDYPVEKVDITQAHLKFASWVTSGGTTFADWFMDKPGYRNPTKLFVW